MAAVRFFSFSFFFFFFLFTTLNLSSISLSITDEQILLSFKSSISNGDVALSSWVPGTPPCAGEWAGVVCNDGAITGIHIVDLGLSGKIDPAPLVELTTLRTLSFSNNSLSGPIPEFNRLGALKALILSFNQFSGEVPDDYFSKMGSLKKVWLSGNNFTGKIPESLTKLPMLIELHLENNQFTGSIPDFNQTSLSSVDFSNNKLEGPIPDGLAKFDPKYFAGNDGLCGKLVDKACPAPPPKPTENKQNQPVSNNNGSESNSESKSSSDSENTRKLGFALALAIATIVLILVALASAKRKEDEEDDFTLMWNSKRQLEVLGGGGGSGRRGGSSRGKKGSSHGGKIGGSGDLIMVNEEKPTFGLADLMKAAAEVIGNGGLGSAYKAVMSNGLSVVVKRIRVMNRVGRDTFDHEMRRMGKLRHKNILSPLSYHYRKEEKLVVSEFVPKGSLLNALHGDRGTCHAELTWPIRLKIVKGIARGLGFLHEEFGTHDLPHGNLKSSNVLLGENYESLLNDYAFHPLLYHSRAAKSLFACKTPEYIEHQHVSPKSDVYCLGIIILEILTGKFPSQYLTAGKGTGTDVVQWVHSAAAQNKEVELIDPELTGSASPTWMDEMKRLLKIGVACTEASPGNRPGVKEAIRRIDEVQVQS